MHGSLVAVPWPYHVFTAAEWHVLLDPPYPLYPLPCPALPCSWWVSGAPEYRTCPPLPPLPPALPCPALQLVGERGTRVPDMPPPLSPLPPALPCPALQLVGERGTRVPDMACKEIVLEVEAAMGAGARTQPNTKHTALLWHWAPSPLTKHSLSSPYSPYTAPFISACFSHISACCCSRLCCHTPGIPLMLTLPACLRAPLLCL